MTLSRKNFTPHEFGNEFLQKMPGEFYETKFN